MFIYNGILSTKTEKKEIINKCNSMYESQNIMLSKESRHTKIMYCLTLFITNLKERKIKFLIELAALSVGEGTDYRIEAEVNLGSDEKVVFLFDCGGKYIRMSICQKPANSTHTMGLMVF